MTIRRLAELSGVSIGTVSRALNGYEDVRPETRERIIRLARELDYTPAAAARTLVTRKSHLVGVFLETGEGHPDLQHPFFHEVLGGFKGAIGADGYDLLLFAAERPGNGHGGHSYLQRCRHRHVDGAVVMGVDPADPGVRELLDAALPCVGVDVAIEGTATTFVMSDNRAGTAQAMQHLFDMGHRRIACVTGLLDKTPGAERLRGYREALARLGLGARGEYVETGDFYFESGRAAAARLLALAEPPTAIVAASDMMASGVIRAAAEAGVSVPGDLSVVGFDDIELAAYMSPGLTTVRQDKARLGEAAGRLLLAEIDGTAPPQPVTLDVTLVVRGSTAPPQSG